MESSVEVITMMASFKHLYDPPIQLARSFQLFIKDISIKSPAHGGA
jgi:hypothetical protein